jgi:arsenite methyltransferase
MAASAAIAVSEPRVSLELDSPELAATYDEVGTRQFNHGKILIQAVGVQPGERVLDVGCGTGRLGQYVAELVGPGGAVFGIDPLPLRVGIAAAKHTRFRTSVGRAEDLSAFADQSFNLVYANSVFHWVSDKPRALREALRVLKPGGRIAVNSADGDHAHQSQSLVREALLEEGLSDVAAAREGGHNYRVNAAELQALLEGAGFREVVVSAHTFVDDVSGADDLIRWSSSSSFGNFLTELDAGQRQRVRDRLESKLQAYRGPKGIQLERYLVFAVARRP